MKITNITVTYSMPANIGLVSSKVIHLAPTADYSQKAFQPIVANASDIKVTYK